MLTGVLKLPTSVGKVVKRWTSCQTCYTEPSSGKVHNMTASITVILIFALIGGNITISLANPPIKQTEQDIQVSFFVWFFFSQHFLHLFHKLAQNVVCIVLKKSFIGMCSIFLRYDYRNR